SGVAAEVERRVRPGRGRGIPELRGEWSGEAHVVDVLRRRETCEELDRPRLPAGDVARQLLEHHRGALAAPTSTRVADIAAKTDPGRIDRPDRPDAKEIADIGDDPFLAGLDKPVLVEPGDVGINAVELGFDRAQ